MAPDRTTHTVSLISITHNINLSILNLRNLWKSYLRYLSITSLYLDNVSSIYTSGRKCNFQDKGCDASHLQPININGWFWAEGNKRIPPTNIPSRLTFWSRKGDASKPQPDNFAGLKAGKLEVKDDSGLTVEGLQEFYDEACLAVLNNKYNDGIQWHDVPCYFRSRIICEDSDLQMARVKKEKGVDVSIPLTAPTEKWKVPSLNQSSHKLVNRVHFFFTKIGAFLH